MLILIIFPIITQKHCSGILFICYISAFHWQPKLLQNMMSLKIILLEGLWQKMEWIPQEYSQEIWQTHFGGPRCTLCTFVQITIFNMFMGINIHNVHMWLSNLLCHMPWLHYCGIHYIFYIGLQKVPFLCAHCASNLVLKSYTSDQLFLLWSCHSIGP